jgi:hypothetical protein
VACEAVFQVPAHTWVGSGDAAVTGPAEVVITGDLATGIATLDLYSEAAGTHHVTARVGSQVIQQADGTTTSDGSPAKANVVFTDITPPGEPVVNPSNGKEVTGNVDPDDADDAANGELEVVIIDQTTGEEIKRCPVQADGTFRCPLVPPLEDGDKIKVVIEDKAGNQSDPVAIEVDAVAPGEPVVDPSDGTKITGKGETEGDTITVTGPNGSDEVLCTAKVKADLTWSCDLVPPLKEGDTVVIREYDPANNVSLDKTWRIGVPSIQVAHLELAPLEQQIVTGKNFQPGEVIQGTMHSDPLALGSKKADANGNVTITWQIPADTAAGTHHVELAGASSGLFEAEFEVVKAEEPATPTPSPSTTTARPATKLPFTGSAASTAVAGAAFGLVLAGLLLVLAAKRRRREQAQ